MHPCIRCTTTASERPPRETGPHAELVGGLSLGLLPPLQDARALSCLRSEVKDKCVLDPSHQVVALEYLTSEILADHPFGCEESSTARMFATPSGAGFAVFSVPSAFLSSAFAGDTGDGIFRRL